jgi:hypothetical protein
MSAHDRVNDRGDGGMAAPSEFWQNRGCTDRTERQALKLSEDGRYGNEDDQRHIIERWLILRTVPGLTGLPIIGGSSSKKHSAGILRDPTEENRAELRRVLRLFADLVVRDVPPPVEAYPQRRSRPPRNCGDAT